MRSYLESLGFSQTTDSYVEGTLADMVFYNPVIAPGTQFIIEIKADELTLKSKIMAREFVATFRKWQSQTPDERFTFWLFIQGLKRPKTWESLFSEVNDIEEVRNWCDWYNEKCRNEDEAEIKTQDIKAIAKFFATSRVTVANHIELELAVAEKGKTSISEISRYAQKLLNVVERRKSPIKTKSKLIMNILPIKVPEKYFTCKSNAGSKREIYDCLEGKIVPPFLFNYVSKTITSFSKYDENNPLTEFCTGSINDLKTKNLQIENPTLAAQLIHIHLRRIIWNKGIWYDSAARIFYSPIFDETKNVRLETNYTGNKLWVTKRYVYQKDTEYAKKGDTNFYTHRGFELNTPTYWGESHIEINPRRYYTLNGKNPIEGKIRSKIDARFRKTHWNRSKIRLRLMKFWKYFLFESKEWAISPEQWFEKFVFGEFLTEMVRWSPRVVGRDQTLLWDYQVISDG